MYQAVIVIHILLGLSIIGLILIQQGKGADAGAGFGGGASGSVFGAQGAASFLSRTTAILATCFFITSLGLAWMNSNKTAVSDFMSSTSPEEKAVIDLGLPDVKDKTKDNTATPAQPAVPPVSAPPVVPSTSSTENQPPAPAITTEQKAEIDKVVEEKQPGIKPELPEHESATGKKK
jgi:preprotein translocase subunit SecG